MNAHAQEARDKAIVDLAPDVVAAWRAMQRHGGVKQQVYGSDATRALEDLCAVMDYLAEAVE